MTNDHWTDRLSDYLDGDLDARQRAECEAHLETCAECSETLEELRAVVGGAALLQDEAPGHDLWPGIARRMEPRGDARQGTVPRRSTRVLAFPTRRVSFTIPQLAAAAIALVILSASSVWLLLPVAPGAPAVASTPLGLAVPVSMTTEYDDAIRQLDSEFARRRDTLDPETVRVVETNLAIIDSAISDAREALAGDPSSGFLQTHLASAMRQKVQLLSRIATLETTEI